MPRDQNRVSIKDSKIVVSPVAQELLLGLGGDLRSLDRRLGLGVGLLSGGRTVRSSVILTRTLVVRGRGIGAGGGLVVVLGGGIGAGRGLVLVGLFVAITAVVLCLARLPVVGVVVAAVTSTAITATATATVVLKTMLAMHDKGVLSIG